ncbi:MAG: PTS sugar transporter subunit IIB [Erysipelotrichaceae bacterium]|nr:PTS sugar transporter subunit IIB [Erysipelotrichaceae bacterium]
MVELVRVDGRLIHGMIAVTWCGVLHPDILAVANDAAANNETHKMALKLAKPGNVEKCLVWTLDRAVEKLQESKFDRKKIFLVTGTVEDAYYIIKRVKSIKKLNIGPEVDGEKGRDTTGKLEISDGVYTSPEKFALLKELHDDGVEVFAQITPAMSKTDFDQFAKKFE